MNCIVHLHSLATFVSSRCKPKTSRFGCVCVRKCMQFNPPLASETLMREKGVRVLFSPEIPRRPAAPHARADRANKQSHSDVATNERTSKQRLAARTASARAGGVNGNLAGHLRKRLPNEHRLKQVRTTFAALADEQRLKIVLALTAADELCVSEVANVIGASVSVASHHLCKLRDLGILEDRSEGKLACYSLKQPLVARLVVTALDAGGA